jgi:hypothetical protein
MSLMADQEQIDDICLKSKEVWEKQAAARAKTDSDKPLKRPLHQPVLMSSPAGIGSRKRTIDRKGHGSRKMYHGRKKTEGAGR